MTGRSAGGPAHAPDTRQAWEEARNLLCVRLDTIGDVLMTTPAVRALKQLGGERRVTILTSPAGAEIAALVPEIDDVIVYEAPWMKATGSRTSSAADHAMIEELRARGFDGAVIFTVFSQNPLPAALFCHLADIPLRLAHCRENPYQLLTDWVREPEPEDLLRHEVQRQLELVAAVGARPADERMSLAVGEDARRAVREVLDDLGLQRLADDGAASAPSPWAVVHPGATAPSRRWNPVNFGETMAALNGEGGWRFVVTGVPAESELARTVVDEAVACGVEPLVASSLCGTFDLEGMAALLEATPMLISNNTGPVHMAAAVGTPVVDLYALTNPQHAPWRVPHRVLSHDVPCKYCYKSVCPLRHNNCLQLVTPDEAAVAALELYGDVYETAARSRPRPRPRQDGWDRTVGEDTGVF